MMISDIAAVNPTSTGRESRSARNPRRNAPRAARPPRPRARERPRALSRGRHLLRDRRDRSRREDRTRRCRSHLRLAERAGQPVGEPGDRRRVEPDDRRQPREAGIREAAGHRCRPHRHARAYVPAKIAHAVAVQRAQRRQEPHQPQRTTAPGSGAVATTRGYSCDTGPKRASEGRPVKPKTGGGAGAERSTGSRRSSSPPGSTSTRARSSPSREHPQASTSPSWAYMGGWRRARRGRGCPPAGKPPRPRRRPRVRHSREPRRPGGTCRHRSQQLRP